MVNASSGEIKKCVEKYLTELLDNQIYEYIDYSTVDIDMFQIETRAETKIGNIFNKYDVFEEIEMSGSCEAEAKFIYPVKLIRLKY